MASPSWASTELPFYGTSNTSCLSTAGLTENSLDSLAFESLIPKPILQRYVSLLVEHRRIILSGPSGTGKTYLANRLSEYLVLREGRELTDGVIATFNVDHKSSKVRRSFGGCCSARGHFSVQNGRCHPHRGGRNSISSTVSFGGYKSPVKEARMGPAEGKAPTQDLPARSSLCTSTLRFLFPTMSQASCLVLAVF